MTLLLVALALLDFARAATLNPIPSDAIEGEYIVVFRRDSHLQHRNAHFKMLESANATVTHKYSFAHFFGYATQVGADGLAIILADECVAYVDANRPVTLLDCETEEVATDLWGLARTSNRARDNLDFHFDSTVGDNTDVYVLDTGIYCEHNAFTDGRCHHGTNTIGGDNSDDRNGHGTHVAATIVGDAYGICRRCHVYAVKVLGPNKSGCLACIIAGVDWVANRAKSTGRRSLMNLSLASGLNQAFNDAIDNAVEAGVVAVVASGNSNTNACNTSPGSAPLAVTVNAIEKGDVRASFSNYGTCSDIFAPGRDILSAWIGGPQAARVISGTSMAAPHVTGIMAVLSAQTSTPWAPARILNQLLELATEDVVEDARDSPNKLVYNSCQ